MIFLERRWQEDGHLHLVSSFSLRSGGEKVLGKDSKDEMMISSNV